MAAAAPIAFAGIAALLRFDEGLRAHALQKEARGGERGEGTRRDESRRERLAAACGFGTCAWRRERNAIREALDLRSPRRH